jgi:hypothetical protein
MTSSREEFIMSTTAPLIFSDLSIRILKEGYGAEAWHGPELKAAISDVPATLAFWRPGKDRHNIAEIAMHHAYYVHSVRGRLSDKALEPFALNGEDWFPVADGRALPWPDIAKVVDREYTRLSELVGDIDAGRVASPLSDADRFALILGITCHAVYHAGQIQLIKKLHG